MYQIKVVLGVIRRECSPSPTWGILLCKRLIQMGGPTTWLDWFNTCQLLWYFQGTISLARFPHFFSTRSNCLPFSVAAWILFRVWLNFWYQPSPQDLTYVASAAMLNKENVAQRIQILPPVFSYHPSFWIWAASVLFSWLTGGGLQSIFVNLLLYFIVTRQYT